MSWIFELGNTESFEFLPNTGQTKMYPNPSTLCEIRLISALYEKKLYQNVRKNAGINSLPKSNELYLPIPGIKWVFKIYL